MIYTEEFLKDICKEKVVGDFYPFDTNNLDEVNSYIRKIVGRLRNISGIKVEADFDSYGSGFASYINVKISKKDRSDTKIITEGLKKTEWIKGITIYICSLAPFWYFGGNEWTISFEKEKWIGGSGSFLRPESIDSYDKVFWEKEVEQIKHILGEFRYNLLTKQELEKELWFNVDIPTVLVDPPYQVFDCFFYWED